MCGIIVVRHFIYVPSCNSGSAHCALCDFEGVTKQSECQCQLGKSSGLECSSAVNCHQPTKGTVGEPTNPAPSPPPLLNLGLGKGMSLEAWGTPGGGARADPDHAGTGSYMMMMMMVSYIWNVL